MWFKERLFNSIIKANKIYITKLDKYETAHFTITYNGTSGISLDKSLGVARIAATGKEAFFVKQLSIGSTDSWKTSLEHLPKYDTDGNLYYYWVEEEPVSGYRAAYARSGDVFTIQNTKTESSTTTMPSTGGNGARKYYTVGGMLLMLSACGWAMRRRRRVIPH